MKERPKIEQDIGFSLDWRRDHEPGVKRSDIRAVKLGGQITDSTSELAEYKRWAVETILKFVDVFRPRIRGYLRSR